MSVEEATQFIRDRFGHEIMREAFLSDPGGYLGISEAEELGMSDEVAAEAITIIQKEWT